MAGEQSVMAVIRASRPTFRSPHDKVAYAIHASFFADGYVLTATGPPAFADDALSSTSTDEVGIDGWNQFEDNYGFVYSNPEKGSTKVLVKCLAMNDKLFVDSLRDGDSEPLHLEIDVGEYVAENGGSNYSSQYKNLGKLVSVFDKEILSKLSGPKTSNSTTNPRSSEMRESRADTNQPEVGVTEPQVPQPYNPSGSSSSNSNNNNNNNMLWMRETELKDDSQRWRERQRQVRQWRLHSNNNNNNNNNNMLWMRATELSDDSQRWRERRRERQRQVRQWRLHRGVVPPIYPTIGGSDLFPGAGAGMYPPRGDFGSGGDMLVGPDHPLFGGRIGGQQPGFPGGEPGVPPGARFDPYGPPGVPGFEPNRFTRRNLRRPGGGTHPDLEHFRDNDFI